MRQWIANLHAIQWATPEKHAKTMTGELRREVVGTDRFRDRLVRLQPRQRMAFAVACAERVLWRLIEWANEYDETATPRIEDAIRMLWDVIEERRDASGLGTYAATIESLVPDPDEQEVTLGADDAALALLYAINCAIKAGDTSEALDAAERSYAAWLHEETLGDRVATDDVLDSRERTSSVLQREIAYQRDLLARVENEPRPSRKLVQQAFD